MGHRNIPSPVVTSVEDRPLSGTSQATALVSLTAGILYSQGIMAPKDIKNRILASTDFNDALRGKVTILNHIEVGLFARDNQIEVANKNGDLLATREKGGIKGGVKGVCNIILADWRKPQPPQAAVPAQQQEPQGPQAQQALDQAASQPQPEPQTIQLGQSSDQVRATLGQPDKIVNLGAKQIYVYKDLKVTFLSKKVSDVQ